jgi:hypothetical protein
LTKRIEQFQFRWEFMEHIMPGLSPP